MLCAFQGVVLYVRCLTGFMRRKTLCQMLCQVVVAEVEEGVNIRSAGLCTHSAQ